MQPRPVHAAAADSGRGRSRSRWSCCSGRAGDTAARWRNACCFRFWPMPCLTGYAATVQIVSYRAAPREQFVRIALVDGPPGADRGQAGGTDPAASLRRRQEPAKAEAIPADKDRKAVKLSRWRLTEAKPHANSPQISTKAAGAARRNRKRSAGGARDQAACKHLAAQASRSPDGKMAEAAGKYLQDFSTAAWHRTEQGCSSLRLRVAAPSRSLRRSTPATVAPAPATDAPTATVAANATPAHASSRCYRTAAGARPVAGDL